MASAMVLSDYLVAQKRVERMTKEAKRDAEWTALNKAIEAFEKEVPLRDLDLAGEEERAVSGFRFLTRLPVLLVLNVGEESMKGEPFPELSGRRKRRGFRCCACAPRWRRRSPSFRPPSRPSF
jgi:ribosome-binding ATPase YchF (GTP1/OBG family)